MLLPLITGMLHCLQTNEYHEVTFSSGRCRYLSNCVLFVRVAPFVPETHEPVKMTFWKKWEHLYSGGDDSS